MVGRPWKKEMLLASIQATFLISIRGTMTLCNIQTSSCVYLIVISILHFLCNCSGPGNFGQATKCLIWFKFRLRLLIY